jgi:hypothetical protein
MLPPILEYERNPIPQVRGNWLLLDLRQMRQISYLPPFCIQCLRSTTGKWRVPTLSGAIIMVHVCSDCQKRWNSRYRKFINIGTALVFIVAAAVGCSFGHKLTEIVVAFSGTLFMGLCALAIFFHWIGVPIHVSLLSRNGDNSKVLVRFPNVDYFKLLTTVRPGCVAPHDLPVASAKHLKTSASLDRNS